MFDLDYQLRFVDRGGGSISNMEYRLFRNTGNAFQFVSKKDETVKEGEEKEPEEKEADEAKYPNNSLISSLVTHKA